MRKERDSRHREAAESVLGVGVSEDISEFGCVGHRNGRPIGEVDGPSRVEIIPEPINKCAAGISLGDP